MSASPAIEADRAVYAATVLCFLATCTYAIATTPAAATAHPSASPDVAVATSASPDVAVATAHPSATPAGAEPAGSRAARTSSASVSAASLSGLRRADVPRRRPVVRRSRAS